MDGCMFHHILVWRFIARLYFWVDILQYIFHADPMPRTWHRNQNHRRSALQALCDVLAVRMRFYSSGARVPGLVEHSLVVFDVCGQYLPIQPACCGHQKRTLVNRGAACGPAGCCIDCLSARHVQGIGPDFDWVGADCE
jgi:hypothetical protein